MQARNQHPVSLVQCIGTPCILRIFASHSRPMEKDFILRLSRAIQDIIIKSGQPRLRPKELMPDLIAQGFFKKDEKFGKPLRDVMNRLDRTDQLGLIPQVVPDRQEKAVYWYFEAADMPVQKPEKKPAAKKATPKAVKVKTTEVTTAAAKKAAAKEIPATRTPPVKKSTVVPKLKAVPVKKVAAGPKADKVSVKKTVAEVKTKKLPAKKTTVEPKVAVKKVPAKKADSKAELKTVRKKP
ncbi:MAG: hypothetical protein K9J06_15635 [Flavobacteriales bacterium]|nr:hypothetical protein [Flavobacteriales bacterium]